MAGALRFAMVAANYVRSPLGARFQKNMLLSFQRWDIAVSICVLSTNICTAGCSNAVLLVLLPLVLLLCVVIGVPMP